MNLIRELAKYFPDWREHYSNPLDAAASIGLLDEEPDMLNPLELDFDHKLYLEDLDDGDEES